MVAEGDVPSFVDDKMSPIVFLVSQRQSVTMSVLKQARVSIKFTVGSSGSSQRREWKLFRHSSIWLAFGTSLCCIWSLFRLPS
jgi:hypothetical protein